MKVSMPSWSHRNVGILCVMNQTQRDWKCIIIKSKSNTIVGFFSYNFENSADKANRS